jgi:serine/threonine-protein kinase
MADVYLAIRTGPIELATIQVLKSMRPDLADDPAFVAMFLDEARLAVRLNHPNVVHTTEVEFEAGLYLAMEYLEGQPLNVVTVRAERHGGLALSSVVRIVSDVLAGLHYAHELRDYDGTPLGIVHRDVSPGNVFVTYDGQVKLVDFGIAKAAVRASETQVGVLKGKVGYMAPEQMMGREVDRRSDVFSAGVVLWELAARRRLWGPDEVRGRGMMPRGAPLLRTVRADLPPQLERICARALALDPAQRYANAAEMQEELEALVVAAKLRSSSREAADFMMRAFPGERGAVRAFIDRRISELRREGDVTAPKSAPHSLSPPSSSGSQSMQGHLPQSSARDSVPAEPTSVSMRPAAARDLRGRHAVALALVGAGAGVALGALLALRAAVGVPTRPAAPVNGASSAAIGTTSAAPREPEPSSAVQIRIVASPPDAEIWVDGAEVSANPFSGKFSRDGRLHTIEVRAHGHETKAQLVEFASDVELIVTLDRYPNNDPSRPRTAPPAASAPASPGPKPRTIDTSDPWR